MLVLLGASCVVFPARRAEAIFGIGDIVFDPAVHAEMVETLRVHMQTFNTAVSTLRQAETIVNAVRGSRNIGEFLLAGIRASDLMARYGYLSPEVASALESASNAARMISDINRQISSATMSMESYLSSRAYERMTPQQRSDWKRQIDAIASAGGRMRATYDNAARRTRDLARYNDALERAQDLKSLEHINGLMQAEHLQIQNELVAIQAYRAKREAERDQQEQESLDRLRSQGLHDQPRIRLPATLFR
jgi:hypothetical protein